MRPDADSRAAASISVSMPLRGTSRLTLSTRGPVVGRPSRARVLARSMGASGTNRVVSTPGGIRATGGRELTTRRASASGYRPPAITSEASAQHPDQRRPAARKTGRDRHLGAVQDHGVRQAQGRTDQPQRHGGVEDHRLRPDLRRQPPDPASQHRVREQDGLPGPLDAKGLIPVEEVVVHVRGGEHGDVVRRQPTPQLPEVGLDPADLRGKVVGDEQVAGHVRPRQGARPAPAYSSATSGSGSSARRSTRSVKPRRAGRPDGVGPDQRVRDPRAPGRAAPTTSGSDGSAVLPSTIRALRRT